MTDIELNLRDGYEEFLADRQDHGFARVLAEANQDEGHKRRLVTDETYRDKFLMSIYITMNAIGIVSDVMDEDNREILDVLQVEYRAEVAKMDQFQKAASKFKLTDDWTNLAEMAEEEPDDEDEDYRDVYAEEARNLKLLLDNFK